MQPLLLQLALAAALTAEQSAAVGDGAAGGHGHDRREAAALAVDGEGELGPVPELLREGYGDPGAAGAGLASAAVAPNGAATFWRERGRPRRSGETTDPPPEQLDLTARAEEAEGGRPARSAASEGRRWGPLAFRTAPSSADAERRRRAPLAEEQAALAEEQPEEERAALAEEQPEEEQAALAEGQPEEEQEQPEDEQAAPTEEQPEAAFEEEQRPEEPEEQQEPQEEAEREEEAQQEERAPEALVELPAGDAGQDGAPSAATAQGSAAASIRREPPPRRPREALAPDAPAALGQVSSAGLFQEAEQGQQAQAPATDKDLKAELAKDGMNLMRTVRWKVNWKVALSFLASITTGLIFGIIVGLLTGALKAEDNSGVTLGGVLLVISVCCLAAVITPSVMVVHDLLYNLELIGGQMIDFGVARIGSEMLVRISDLEAASSNGSTVDWAINLTNPSNDAITFTRIVSIVSINDTAVLLSKMKPLPVTIQAGTTGPVPLSVDARGGQKIRVSFAAITRGGREWAATFKSEKFDLAIEGKFRGKDFIISSLCMLPFRLADLPLPSTWPAGLDRAAVSRSITAGLAHLHSDSKALITLPGQSKSILDYNSLKVQGPLRTWFTWSMILCSAFALPFSCCLSLGGLKLAGGIGKPSKAGEESATAPLADAAADPAAAEAAAPGEAAVGGGETAPPGTPTLAATPAPAQAESPPPTRSTRSARSAQAKPAPAPAPAPAPTPAAGGGDDDEHEF